MSPARYRVVTTPRALADLDRVLDTIGKASPSNAARMFDELWTAMQSLVEFPHRYTVVQGRQDPAGPVHRMPVPPYVVYYRVNDSLHVVRILTVMHGRQRRPRRFG